ncbi:MAG: hypothetical protein V4753_09380 [Pseudomonadota bacterium]
MNTQDQTMIGMSLRAPFALTFLLVASGCQQATLASPASREPVRVTNNGQPFAMWEGSLARRAADAACGGKVNVSIYDWFDRATGEWVYPEGCA